MMKIMLQNLPPGCRAEDVVELLYDLAKVESVSPFEEGTEGYLVELWEDKRVVADQVVAQLNGLHWRGAQIVASVLLFQDDTDPAA